MIFEQPRIREVEFTELPSTKAVRIVARWMVLSPRRTSSPYLTDQAWTAESLWLYAIPIQRHLTDVDRCAIIQLFAEPVSASLDG